MTFQPNKSIKSRYALTTVNSSCYGQINVSGSTSGNTMSVNGSPGLIWAPYISMSIDEVEFWKKEKYRIRKLKIERLMKD